MISGISDNIVIFNGNSSQDLPMGCVLWLMLRHP